ncbi:hypothetical protein QFC21_005144 [Naganishia friedmannii]|uniref:Uncharacterized protein n=1 Tax=Naganishia friedmannii TaxID=89922 RepID=A0ACC2VAE1_9TREE|nr:hypothetical protein QFC21_005144 [Naganishia friedmannii]
MTRTPQPGVPKEVFPCDCGQTYSRLEYLRRHQRKHNDDKPFACTICIKSFARSDVLLRHKRRCHPDEYAAAEESNENGGPGNASDRRKSQSGTAGASSRRGVKRSASGSPSTNARNVQRPRHEERQNVDYPPDADPSRMPYGIPLDGTAGPMDTRSLNYPYGMPGLLNGGMSSGYTGREQSAGFGNQAQWDLGYNRLHTDQSLGYHVNAHGQYNPASSTSLADYQRLTQAQGPDGGDMGMAHHLANDPAHGTSPHDQISQLDPRLGGTYNGTSQIDDPQRFSGRHNEHSYERVSDARFVDPSLSQSGPFPDNGQQMRMNSGHSAHDHHLAPHGIEEAAALLSMAYGHVSAIRSDSLSSDHNIGSGNHNTASSTGETADQNAALHIPISTLEEMAAAVVGHASQSQADETLASMTSGPNPITYTTILNPASRIPPVVAGNLDLDGGATTGIAPPATESWDPFSGPLMPGSASPFDLSALWASGMITAEEENNTSHEPEGWSHLPGSVPAHTTLNTERPLLRINASNIGQRMGKDLNPIDRFYMPKERFIGCYNVPQWRMPSMSTLVRVARQTMSQLIIHVPIVHTPTFRLNEIAPAVAFSLCMVGSPWHSPIAGDHMNKSLTKHSYPYVKMLDQQDWLKGMGVIAPGATTCTVEEIEDTPMEERDFEDRKKLIVTEKSAMMHSLIDAADPQKNTLDEITIGIIQALMIYATPLLLSPSAEQRAMGYVKLAYIIPMTRNLKAFQNSQPHMQLYSSLQVPDGPKDAEDTWRDWIKQETIRRVIWMLFFYDSLSCLEMGVPPSISFAEVANLPLPAPDTVWQARSAEDWRCALTTYRATTLDQSMGFHFQLRPGQDSQSAHYESPKDVSVLVCSDFGMFGRLIMVVSLLRALIQLGQAQVDVADSIIQMWAKTETTSPEKKLNMHETVARCGIALKRWRQGWDFDSLCVAPSSAQTCSSEASPGRQSVSEASSITRNVRSDTLDSRPSDASNSPSGEYDELAPRSQGKTLFYEEALPFYWLAQALHNVLANDPSVLRQRNKAGQDAPTPPAGSWNKFAGMDFKQMLQSARVFTRMGEGVKMPAGF